MVDHILFHLVLGLLPDHISYGLLTWLFNEHIFPILERHLQETSYARQFERLVNLKTQLTDFDLKILELYKDLASTLRSLMDEYKAGNVSKDTLYIYSKAGAMMCYTNGILMHLNDTSQEHELLPGLGSIPDISIATHIRQIFEYKYKDDAYAMLENKLREMCETEDIDLGVYIEQARERWRNRLDK